MHSFLVSTNIDCFYAKGTIETRTIFFLEIGCQVSTVVSSAYPGNMADMAQVMAQQWLDKHRTTGPSMGANYGPMYGIWKNWPTMVSIVQPMPYHVCVLGHWTMFGTVMFVVWKTELSHRWPSCMYRLANRVEPYVV